MIDIKLNRIVDSITCWLDENEYRYYSINSTPKLHLNNKYVGIAWRQLFRILPINLRPFFGLKCGYDNKSIILFAIAFLILFEKTDDSLYWDHFAKCIDLILGMQSKQSKNFAIRQGKSLHLKNYSAAEDDISPLLTALTGSLILQCLKSVKCEVKNYKNWKDYLSLICSYFMDELDRNEHGADYIYFAYSPGMTAEVYNGSAGISSFLLLAGDCLEDNKIKEYGRKGINYILIKQNPDGSWNYGSGKTNQYVDNFHTAFILKSLFDVDEFFDGNCEFRENLNRAVKYYRQRLLRERNGRIDPRHFDAKMFPRNSNLIQKLDLRDVVVPLLIADEIGIEDLRLQLIDILLNKFIHKGLFVPEYTWLWKNNIPYVEFQAWGVIGIAHMFCDGSC